MTLIVIVMDGKLQTFWLWVGVVFNLMKYLASFFYVSMAVSNITVDSVPLELQIIQGKLFLISLLLTMANFSVGFNTTEHVWEFCSNLIALIK